MNAEKKSLRRRTPLADCTNTVASASSLSSTSSSSSSSKPSLPAVKEPRGDALKSVAAVVPSRDTQNPRDSRHRPYAFLRTGKFSSGSVTGDCEVIKSGTVYTCRGPAENCKNMEKASSITLSCATVERPEKISKIGDQFNVALRDGALSKSWKVSHPRPHKKMKNLLPKDLIKQQRAYFAEIDAFELPEQVVSSSESE